LYSPLIEEIPQIFLKFFISGINPDELQSPLIILPVNNFVGKSF